MKKNYIMLILVLFGYSITAQVGINTSNPKSTLHVEGRSELTFADGIIPPRLTGDLLRSKAAAYGADQNGAIVYVTSPVTNPNPATEPKTQDVANVGFFVYDAFYVHPNSTQGIWNKVPSDETLSTSGIYSAKFNGTFTLLGLTILSPTQNYIGFSANTSGNFTVQVPSSQMAAGIYTVPSDGIYHIDYSYREGTGLKVGVLSDSSVNIIKTPATGTADEIVASRDFIGLGGLVNLSITETQISHVYRFKKGDKLKFGFKRVGLLTVDLANTIDTEISIYKIR